MGRDFWICKVVRKYHFPAGQKSTALDFLYRGCVVAVGHRMALAFPLQLEKGSKALGFEVGIPTRRESVSLRLWISIF